MFSERDITWITVLEFEFWNLDSVQWQMQRNNRNMYFWKFFCRFDPFCPISKCLCFFQEYGCFFSMLSSIVKCISAAVVILPPFSEKGGIQKHPTKIIQHNQEGQELQLELGFVKGSSSLHGFASSCRGPTLGGPIQHSMFLWPLVQFLFQCPHSSHARQVFFIHLVGHIKHIFGLAKTLQFKIWQFKDIL